MRKPYVINSDDEFKTLQDCVEQMALGIADDVKNGEKPRKYRVNVKSSILSPMLWWWLNLNSHYEKDYWLL